MQKCETILKQINTYVSGLDSEISKEIQVIIGNSLLFSEYIEKSRENAWMKISKEIFETHQEKEIIHKYHSASISKCLKCSTKIKLLMSSYGHVSYWSESNEACK